MGTALIEHKLESLTQELGREMFAQTRAASAGPLKREWWQEQLMQQFMRYEWLKIQSFRFIDALPTLTDDREVARHMREYLVHPRYARSRLNGANGRVLAGRNPLEELEPVGTQDWLYRMVSRLLDFRRLDSAWATALVKFSRWSTGAMAGTFIAGANIDEAVRAIQRMRRQKLAFTIDVLGESAVSASEAQQYYDTYLHLIDELPGRAAQWESIPLIDAADGAPIPRVNVSVKLTSLYPGFDPLAAEASKARAKELLRPLLRRAMQHGVHIQVDMEHYAIKDLTIETFEELVVEPEFRDYPHVGLVLQAYLKDGDRDIQRLIALAKRRGAPVTIRLVKGAYWDSESVKADQRGWPWPVWEQKWMSDACFERMTRAMLENHEVIHSAFASHNIRSLCHALALKRLLNVPEKAFEWQMLYGMGDPMKRASVRLGERCRVYTPFGELMPGMAYFIRRLLENTANESFLRIAADESQDAELLRAPEELGAETPQFARPPLIRYEFEEPLMDPFVNTPDTDFGRPENRAQMLAALSDARSAVGDRYPLLIDGEAVQTDETFTSVNPSRPREIIGTVAAGSAEHVKTAVAAADRVLAAWRQTPVTERADVLRAVADGISARRFELAALQILECGKPWRDADADVSAAIDACRYYAKEMERITDHPRDRDVPGETNEYFYHPRGVTAVITPANAPLSVPAAMLAAALVSGNTVVFKPARRAAVTAARLVQLFTAAGLAPGVLNYLPGGHPDVGEALVAHPAVATIAFAGRRATGLRVNTLAASVADAPVGFKRLVANLGGANGLIIDSDADLGEAIRGTLTAAFGYAGQSCASASRVIVVGGIYDRFVERLVEAARSKGVGPADEPTAAIPPLLDQAAFDRVRQLIEQGKTEATCLLETDTTAEIEESSGGFFVGPTIFADVPPGAPLVRDEIMGPVLCLIRAETFEDALARFNENDAALVGGIYSRSPQHIDQARQGCQCGNLYINRVITDSRIDRQPFGGFKLAGTGAKLGGPDYLLQFCNARSITENTIRRGFAPSEAVEETVG